MSKALENKVKLNDFVSVKDFGAVGDGVADDTIAIQNAINSGASVFFPSGIYTVSSQLTNTGDMLLWGSPGSAIRDYGNNPSSRVLLSNNGAVIKWTGSNSTQPILFNPDVARRFACRDLTFHVTNDFATSIIKLKGSKWYSYTGVTPQIDIDSIALYRDSQGTTPGSSTAVGIEFDLTDTVIPRQFFGSMIRNVFAYGLNQVYYLVISNQTTPTTGNFFNSNTIGHTQAYKCYRIANLAAGSTAYDQASLNHFGPWYIQPVGDNSGNMATGVLRLSGNVNRNTFDTIVVYDLAAGGTPRRVIHVSPFSPTTVDAWNRYLNCPDFEVDSSWQMANIVDGAGLIGGAAIGLTGANAWLPEIAFGGSSSGVTYTVQLGRFVKQGRLCFVEADITLNALGGAASGSAVTMTLPVQKAGGPSCVVNLFIINATGSIFGYAAEIGAGAQEVTIYKHGTSGSTAASALTKADVATGTTIRMSAVYASRT